LFDPNAVQMLLEKDEIRELIGVRYARGLDWYDLDLLKSCFHADATLDYGYFKGLAHVWCEKRVVEGNPAELHRFHYCFPAQFAVTGDKAEAESNSISGYRTRDGDAEKTVLFGARYFDRIERRDGVWRMAHRTVRVDFTYEAPSPKQAPGLQSALPFLSALDPSHPLFRRLLSDAR